MRYPEQTRIAVNKEFENLESVPSIAKKYGIPRQTIHRWKDEYMSHYKDGETTNPHKIQYLQKRIDRLNRELEIYKNSPATRYSPLIEKIDAAMELAPKYGVLAVCRVLDLRRSNYYHHLLRSPEQTQIEIGDEKLKPIIKEIYGEAKHRVGAEKIQIILKHRGINTSAKRILRLLKEMDLKCIDRKSKIPQNTDPPRTKFYKNRLKRRFDVSEPNKVWVSDSAYLYLNYEQYYLTAIMDLFSRRIIAYKVVDSVSTPPLIEMFKETFERRGRPEGLMFHSDQGSQFIAYRFKMLLRGYRVTQSFSAAGCPHDNAVIESFFRTFRAELTHCNRFENLEDLKKSVDEYMSFYNDVRPHRKLGFKTPTEAENDYFESHKEAETS